MQHRRGGGVGFTLIEMLIVLVIIAALVAILLPVLARARRAPLATQCLSNLRQVYLAFAQYAQDNDDHLPPYQNAISGFQFAGYPYVTVEDAPEKLVRSLQPYARSTELFFCPADASAQKVGGANGSKNHRFTSYVTNPAIGFSLGLKRSVSLTAPLAGLPTRQDTANPSERFLMGEDTSSAFPPNKPPFYTHNETLNYVIFDGHTKGRAWNSIPH